MRKLALICGCLAFGCGASVPGEAGAGGDPAVLPPDLGTRAGGIDWPCFQGPSGDSVSPEKGMVWPRSGPPLVWDLKLGEGYAMPSISRGRAFVFDRTGDRHRLRALKSETGEQLWSFEYPTNYQDMYNY